MRLSSILLGAACVVAAMTRPVEDRFAPVPSLLASQQEKTESRPYAVPAPRMPTQRAPPYTNTHLARQRCITYQLRMHAARSHSQPVSRADALKDTLRRCHVPLEFYTWYLKRNFDAAADIIDRGSLAKVRDNTKAKQDDFGTGRRRSGRNLWDSGEWQKGRERWKHESEPSERSSNPIHFDMTELS